MATAASKRGFASFICHACRRRLLPLPQHHRTFGTTSVLRAVDDFTPRATETSTATISPAPDAAIAGLSTLRRNLNQSKRARDEASSQYTSLPTNHTSSDLASSFVTAEYGNNLNASYSDQAPHRMHIFSHKHNTHITLVQPPRLASQTAGFSTIGSSAADQKKTIDVLMSISTGNSGFKKSGRGSYDAAYQLAAYFLRQVQEKGLLRDMHKLEVVMRGFGPGREAVQKVLLGTEGRRIRGKISAVVDATRLKLGGPRGKKPRRLG